MESYGEGDAHYIPAPGDDDDSTCPECGAPITEIEGEWRCPDEQCCVYQAREQWDEIMRGAHDA